MNKRNCLTVHREQIPFALMGSYSRLWQSGYSWRDVLHRPDAPDSVGSGAKVPKIKGLKQVTEPKAAEFGGYQAFWDSAKKPGYSGVHRNRAVAPVFGAAWFRPRSAG